MMQTTGFVGRALPVAMLLALSSACSDEGPSYPASGGSGGVADGGEPSQVSGRGGSKASTDGGANSDVPAMAGESSGGTSAAAAGASPQGGDDTAGRDGQAGGGGDRSEPVGPVSRVDAWLAEKPGLSHEFGRALRAVGIEFELLVASTDDNALPTGRAFLLARQCAYYAKLGAPPWTLPDVLDVSAVLGELRAIELDSWERSQKYVHANQAAAGHTFPLVEGSELGASCEQLWSEVAP